MRFSFSKYHGTGNDFILIDDRNKLFPEDNVPLIERICDRHFGIGADGLMLVREAPGYDFRMVYFNSDGRESSMCGNGGRCIAVFAHQVGLPTHAGQFVAVDGPHEYVLNGNTVKLKMIDVEEVKCLDRDYVIHTGSPHFVRFIPDLDNLDIVPAARKIRYSSTYQQDGINVNFVEKGIGAFRMRTYERGVEGETLSCGTGTVAVALALATQDTSLSSPVQIQTPGGNLLVHFSRRDNVFREVWLEGPVTHVFDGTFNAADFR